MTNNEEMILSKLEETLTKIKEKNALTHCITNSVTINDCANAILSVGGQVLITADHGNADCMRTKDGKPFTAHTTNPVPLFIINAGNIKLKKTGALCDIAPTVLDILQIDKPVEMTGESLIEK